MTPVFYSGCFARRGLFLIAGTAWAGSRPNPDPFGGHRAPDPNYAVAVQKIYAGVQQIWVSSDASTISGEDTMFYAVWLPEREIGGWLLPQVWLSGERSHKPTSDTYVLLARARQTLRSLARASRARGNAGAGWGNATPAPALLRAGVFHLKTWIKSNAGAAPALPELLLHCPLRRWRGLFARFPKPFDRSFDTQSRSNWKTFPRLRKARSVARCPSCSLRTRRSNDNSWSSNTKRNN